MQSSVDPPEYLVCFVFSFLLLSIAENFFRFQDGFIFQFVEEMPAPILLLNLNYKSFFVWYRKLIDGHNERSFSCAGISFG